MEAHTLKEHELAKAWRRRAGFTMDALSELIGYSKEAIFLFESGKNSQGKPHAPHAWRRYKLACIATSFLKHHRIDSVDQWEWT
jgi:transcriptional regulator with XRE-family HTH domain